VKQIAKKQNVQPTNNKLYEMTAKGAVTQLNGSDLIMEIRKEWGQDSGNYFVFSEIEKPVMKKPAELEPDPPKSVSSKPSFRPATIMPKRTMVKSRGERRHHTVMRLHAFAQWMDFHMAKRDYYLQDLAKDVTDGVLLINLLEIITGCDLGHYHDKPEMTIAEKLENVSTAVEELYQIYLSFDITAEDIVDGNMKVIVEVLWRVICVSSTSPLRPEITEQDARNGMLEWCRLHTRNRTNIRIDNFSTSWQDGLAFCALVNKFEPDLIDFEAAKSQGPERLDMVLSVLEEYLEVPMLLFPEDLRKSQYSTDEWSVFAYLTILKEIFSEYP